MRFLSVYTRVFSATNHPSWYILSWYDDDDNTHKLILFVILSNLRVKLISQIQSCFDMDRARLIEKREIYNVI